MTYIACYLWCLLQPYLPAAAPEPPRLSPCERRGVDLQRFPDQATAEEALGVNLAYGVDLLGRWDDPRLSEAERSLVGAALGRTARVRRVYYHLSHAHCCYWDDEDDHLRILRGLIGEDAYWGGRLPPCIPLECCETMPDGR